MKVIMGGSGSTGSSLLKNILNRNEDVFSGGETSFFSKKLIYDDWKKAKSRVLKRKLNGLRSFGFHMYNGSDLLLPEYNITEDLINQYALEANTLEEFAELYFSQAMEMNQAKFWIEKTPANSACFKLFLDAFEDGRVIHMTRSPYDTIASLWERGYGLYYSVGIYLLNTASALSAKSRTGRYTEVAYEKLVSSPASTVENVCNFLNITFDSKMLVSQGEVVQDSQLSSWTYDETANIGKGSIGRFSKLPKDKQMAIYEAVHAVQVNKSGVDYYKLSHTNIKSICKELGYEYHSIDSRNTIPSLISQRRKDRAERLKRGYPTGVYYPLEIK